jgi:hypothetical protein
MASNDTPRMPDPDVPLGLNGLDDDTTTGSAREGGHEDPAKGSRHGDGRSRDLPAPEVGDWNRFGAPRGDEKERRDDA